MIKNADGIIRQYTVQDLSRHVTAEGKEPPVCVCLYCKKTFANEQELLVSHPEERVLRKQEESHIFGWWLEESDKKGKITAKLFSDED